MQQNSISSDIKSFYRNYPWLSIILVLSTISLMVMKTNVFYLIYLVFILFFSGRLFSENIGNRWLPLVFLLGGGLSVAGCYFIIPESFTLVLVASTSIASGGLALLAASALRIPDRVLVLFIFGRVKLKWVAMALIAIDVFSSNPLHPEAGSIHMAGVLAGAIFFLIFYAKSFTLFKRKGPKVHYKPQNSASGRPLTDDEYNAQRAQHQKKIDEILDKISKGGYESLSKEEKEFLFRSSSKM